MASIHSLLCLAPSSVVVVGVSVLATALLDGAVVSARCACVCHKQKSECYSSARATKPKCLALTSHIYGLLHCAGGSWPACDRGHHGARFQSQGYVCSGDGHDATFSDSVHVQGLRSSHQAVIQHRHSAGWDHTLHH